MERCGNWISTMEMVKTPPSSVDCKQGFFLSLSVSLERNAPPSCLGGRNLFASFLHPSGKMELGSHINFWWGPHQFLLTFNLCKADLHCTFSSWEGLEKRHQVPLEAGVHICGLKIVLVVKSMCEGAISRKTNPSAEDSFNL